MLGIRREREIGLGIRRLTIELDLLGLLIYTII